MKMHTDGQFVIVNLEEGDIYHGHHQSEGNGHYGVHEFTVAGRPMQVWKHFTQIIDVVDHDGWEIEQKTPGDGSLIKRPPLEVVEERFREGATFMEARAYTPYEPATAQ